MTLRGCMFVQDIGAHFVTVVFFSSCLGEWLLVVCSFKTKVRIYFVIFFLAVSSSDSYSFRYYVRSRRAPGMAAGPRFSSTVLAFGSRSVDISGYCCSVARRGAERVLSSSLDASPILYNVRFLRKWQTFTERVLFRSSQYNTVYPNRRDFFSFLFFFFYFLFFFFPGEGEKDIVQRVGDHPRREGQHGNGLDQVRRDAKSFSGGDGL